MSPLWVWAELLKNWQSIPTIAGVTIPCFGSDAQSPYSISGDPPQLAERQKAITIECVSGF
jgi:hypothetical protein